MFVAINVAGGGSLHPGGRNKDEIRPQSAGLGHVVR
jgi:hypothetical protein